MMALSLCNSLLVSFVVVLIFVGGCSGHSYSVGYGWEEQPSDPQYYTRWSSSQVFYIGDELVFGYDNHRYNVIQVPLSDYENCTAKSPYAVFNHTPTVFPLKETGVYFFLCNISNYCQLGQRVSINVNSPTRSLPLPPFLSPEGPESSPSPSPPVPQESSQAPILSPEPPASNSQSPRHARSTECEGLIGLFALCLMMFL